MKYLGLRCDNDCKLFLNTLTENFKREQINKQKEKHKYG